MYCGVINPQPMCVCVCAFSLFCLLALLGVQWEVSVATARKCSKTKKLFSLKLRFKSYKLTATKSAIFPHVQCFGIPLCNTYVMVINTVALTMYERLGASCMSSSPTTELIGQWRKWVPWNRTDCATEKGERPKLPRRGSKATEWPRAVTILHTYGNNNTHSSCSYVVDM